ncbi:MAG: hypothetical protein K1X89_24985 [Myxococcaceae bacterium]|nr:hypothetical protein [Myxococcaceae bacterium]
MRSPRAASALVNLAGSAWVLLGPALVVQGHGGPLEVGALLAAEGAAFLVLLRAPTLPPFVGALLSALALGGLAASPAHPPALLAVGFFLAGAGFELRRRGAHGRPALELLDGALAVVAALAVAAAAWLGQPLALGLGLAAGLFTLAAVADLGGLGPAAAPAAPRVLVALKDPPRRAVLLANGAMNVGYHLRLGTTLAVALSGDVGLQGLGLATAAALAALGLAPLLWRRGRLGWVVGPALEGAATAALALLVWQGALSVAALAAVEVVRHLGMGVYSQAQNVWREARGETGAALTPYLAVAWGVSPFSALAGATLAHLAGASVPIALSAVVFLALAATLAGATPRDVTPEVT